MKKLAMVFCPYFGKLPNNFDLWLRSASFNEKINFTILTDDSRKFITPKNVSIYKITFKELKEKIQQKFDFPISLDNSYKLCDYKPAYGYIFGEDIVNLNDYLFWGHCDLDVIWGDLNKYLPTDIGKYGKINHAAHFTLYRNDELINHAFMNVFDKVNYKTILSSPVHFAFDEIGNYGINAILTNMEEIIFPYEDYMAKVRSLTSNLILNVNYNQHLQKCIEYDNNKRIFSFEDGKIYDYSIVGDEVIKREWAYIHLQKRKMENKITSLTEDKFLICAHSYEPFCEPTKDLIMEKQVSNFYPDYFKIKKAAGVRKLKRMIAIQKIRSLD